MKKHKLLCIVLVSILTLFSMTFVACSQKDIQNDSIPDSPFADEPLFLFDADYHWKDDSNDKEPHNYDENGICTVCEYDNNAENYLSFVKIDGKDEYAVDYFTSTVATMVEIPTEYKGLPVTAINKMAFYQMTNLKGVSMPDTITTLGASIFEGCTSLTSITIPAGVTSIGNYAFYECSSLTSITIPAGVTRIGRHAFDGCSSLQGVYISDIASWCGITFADYYSNPLYYAKKLYLDDTLVTELVIPTGVTSIGDYAFYNCSSLESIEIPAGVTRIGRYAFDGCRSLTSITVEEGNSVYHSSGNCLIETASKTLIVGCKASVIPSDGSVTSIGERAFYNCRSLTSITIPAGVTSIGRHAFDGCSSLTSITIPTGVTSIGSYAFEYCSSLTSIEIPAGVTSIGWGAFSGCDRIEEATMPTKAIGSIPKGKLKKVTINGGESIGERAFLDCSSLTSITIPAEVTSIGESAFSSCSGLSSITVEEGNSVYHSSGNCLIETASKTLITGCKNSVIPSDGSVTSIGNNAFSGCSSLTSITIPAGVTSIGDYAFYECSSLTSITLEDTSNWYRTNNIINMQCKNGGVAVRSSELSNPSLNASYFRYNTDFFLYYWYKL